MWASLPLDACVSLLLVTALQLRHVNADGPTVVTTIIVPAPKPTGEPSFVDDGDFVASVLNSTNYYRYEHGARPLAWNDSLQNIAQNWTEACDFVHSHGPTGENLAEGYFNVTASIEAWGNERDEYDFDAQGFSEPTGHFTQLVWNTTRTVGCGRKFCTTGIGGWYLVCEYWPPGNVIGSFAQHVSRQIRNGAGYSFQNCTTTNNCTAGGEDASSDGSSDGGSGGSSAGGGSDSGSGGGGSHGGGGGSDQSDASKLIVGPLMAFIVVTATLLGLWEPWQLASRSHD